MNNPKRVILGVTGSIAAYKSADIARRLIEKGLKVSVVMTKEAEYFITPLTLSSLIGEEVYRGTFDSSSNGWAMPHIQLAKKADVLLIAPATANIIAKLAHGFADDLLTCVALGAKAPILIAPAMNTEMYKNKFVQNNCAVLKKHGVAFIDPTKGKLACGDTGEGHIADEEDIVRAVLRALK
ncbi:MAG TPA: flavoprotein [Candidatus Omnitrophota bacterium]|nr:flavoprotein [Candidatus Omnitrophota bacterium]